MASHVGNQRRLKSRPPSPKQAVSHPQKPLAGLKHIAIIYRAFVRCLPRTIFLTSVPHARDDWVSIKAHFVGFPNAEGASRYTWQFPWMREEQVHSPQGSWAERKEASVASERYHIHIFISGQLWWDSGLFLWCVTKRKSREAWVCWEIHQTTSTVTFLKNQTLSPISKT